MAKVHLEVLQPTTTKIDGDFDHVIIPGIDGDFGVYPDHTPFITQIRQGILRVFNDDTEEKYAIHDGFVTVENSKVNIVCEVIEKASEIDEKRAKAALERAEQRMKSTNENINFRRAEASLKRALARLEAIKSED